MRVYYAQNREDLLIASFFPDVKKGFYVDIGANDPIIDSVTKLFYSEGWSGINIEPISRHIKALNTQRPRDTNLKIGLGKKEDNLRFREYKNGDGLSTFNASIQEYYEHDKHRFPTDDFIEYKVPVKRLKDVLAENRVEHIHFMKIDVEGYEGEVIAGGDWETYRPDLLCIEANHVTDNWPRLLKEHKYKEVFFDGINRYYLAKEALFREKYFDYAAAVFAGNPVYYPVCKNMTHTINEMEATISDLSQKRSDQEQELAFAWKQQKDIRFLAKQLAKEVKVRVSKRANPVESLQTLGYKEDKLLDKTLKEKKLKGKKLLSFINSRDKLNVVSVKKKPLEKFIKKSSWVLVSTGIDQAFWVAKKIRRN